MPKIAGGGQLGMSVSSPGELSLADTCLLCASEREAPTDPAVVYSGHMDPLLGIGDGLWSFPHALWILRDAVNHHLRH